MAQKQDPVNPANGIPRDPETPRFLGEESPSGRGPDPQASASSGNRARVPDYARATPEEIAADIERTRAHMDATLSLLGRKLRPRRPGKRVLSALGILALAVLAYLGFAGYRGFRRRRTLGHRLMRASRKGNFRRLPGISWRKAGVVDQSILAAKLALAVRSGKPTIIVVEPHKD